MRSRRLFTGTAASAAAVLAACAAMGPAPAPNDDAAFERMMASSFSDKGIAKVERLKQDASDKACSAAAGAPLPEAQAQAIQAENLKTLRWPADGKVLGDWKAGEKLAQDGRGMTWSDASTEPHANGGSCYNCHQLTASEVSYGTIGPSLYHYGRTRGVTDPGSATAQAVLSYTWSKLYNAKAYNACSNMPRFGHEGLLDETQLKDLMALLLDPKSPVNQ